MPEVISRDIYSNDLEYLEVIDLKSYYPNNQDQQTLRANELVIARLFYPIGFAAYKPPTTRTLALLRLAVNPQHRRQGVATRLIEHVINLTQCSKITVVLRESNLEGCEFLNAVGFKAVNLMTDHFGDEDGIYFVRKV